MQCGPKSRRDTLIMLDSLRNFISELTGGEKHPGRFEENDYRLAAAALLIHASTIDGNDDRRRTRQAARGAQVAFRAR